MALWGVLLLDDDPPARVRWQADTRKRYLDEKPRWERADANFAAAVARGSRRSRTSAGPGHDVVEEPAHAAVAANTSTGVAVHEPAPDCHSDRSAAITFMPAIVDGPVKCRNDRCATDPSNPTCNEGSDDRSAVTPWVT